MEKLRKPSYKDLPPKHLEFGQRLLRAIETSHLKNSSQLGRECGITLPAIRDYVEGFSMPAADKLLRMANALGVSIEWLLTGTPPTKMSAQSAVGAIRESELYATPEDPMKFASSAATHLLEKEEREREASPPAGILDAIRRKEKENETGGEYAPGHKIEPIKAPLVLGREEFIFVPLFDVTASLGAGAHVDEEEIVDHLAFSRRWINAAGLNAPNLSAIRVDGDSMEPTISPGDTVLVDNSVRQLRDAALYVLQQDGLLVVKRLQMMIGGGVRIVSDNPRYAEQVVSSEAAGESLKIIGRVVWIARRV